jgi:STE24 endopeptidase
MTTVGVKEVRTIDPQRLGISPWRPFKAKAEEWLDPELIDRGRRYVGPLTREHIVKITLSTILDLIIIRTHFIPNVLHHLGWHNWVAELFVAFAVLIVVGIPYSLPFDWWEQMVHDKRWEISTRTARTFWIDQLKEAAEGIVLSGVVFTLLFAFIRATHLWWLFGWAAVSVISVGYGLLYVKVIKPIYNKFTPMEDESLHESILAVAHGVGADIKLVEIEDTSKRETRSNAYVGGAGKARRMVVCDTMADWPHNEITWVCGHEIGHWKLRHVIKSVPMMLVLGLINFAVLAAVLSNDRVLHFAGVHSLHNPGVLPLLLFVFPLPTRLTNLVGMYFSRHNEREADLFGLEAVPDPASAAASFRHLVSDNPMDLTPSLWKRLNRSHPLPEERLAMIAEWERRNAATSVT